MEIATEHWTTRIFQKETERRLAEAAEKGVTVLPITQLYGTSYCVIRGGRKIAMCLSLSEAAEVAAALAHYRTRTS